MFYIALFFSNRNIMEADSVSFNTRQDRAKTAPLLQNPKKHYRIHKSPLLILIPSRFESNPHTPPQPVSLNSILTAAAHYGLGLGSGLPLPVFH
jgi:hypothetical protein